MVGVLAVYSVKGGADLGYLPPHGRQPVRILGHSASPRKKDVQV